MAVEYDEKGKIYTKVVSTDAIPATIQTTRQLMRGNLHVRRGERVKDELDQTDPFLALTEATILADDGTVLFSAAFVAVQRSQIVWVLPDDRAHESTLR